MEEIENFIHSDEGASEETLPPKHDNVREDDDKNKDGEGEIEKKTSSAPIDDTEINTEDQMNTENNDTETTEEEKDPENTNKQEDEAVTSSEVVTESPIERQETVEKTAEVSEEAEKSEDKKADESAHYKDAANNGEADYEGTEDYEYYEGYEYEYEEGYDGEEGWEYYEDYDGYEEATEEDAGKEVGTKDKTDEEDKENGESDAEKKENNLENDGDKVTEQIDQVKESQKTNEVSMESDEDGAPKVPDDTNETYNPPTPGTSSSIHSTDEARTPSKLPPGISVSPVPNLPPGISISSPAGKTNLPPGISISPFKRPSISARQSTDEDTRSNASQDDSVSLSDFTRKIQAGEDPWALVGVETQCVFCLEKCGGRMPKLLNCLHSACGECFAQKIRESIRDNSSNDVVDLDGEEVQMAPEVSCPICKATTSEDEVMDNVFAMADPDNEDNEEDDQHMCHSCEENSEASSRCEDCEEFLCSDCVRAHQRVKYTKDHTITALQISARRASLAHLNYCAIHKNEKLTLYCKTCDTLNCRDCQLSAGCRLHQYGYSYDVAPEVKAHLSQSISDIKLKKSGLQESRDVLSSKIANVNSKENHLIEQMTEIKNYLITKLENRHKELVNEISKVCREKKKILEGRKSNLDRSFWQTDYAINFVSHILSTSVSDEKILLTKKMLYRQLKRLRRANNSVGLTPAEMELKLDLYFQHFTSQNLHTKLNEVMKMVMSDLKVSSVPVEAPKPKPPPQPVSQPSPARQPPVTPTRPNLQNSPRLGTSPGRLGLVSRQLHTPQKQAGRSPGGVRPGPSPNRMVGGQVLTNNRLVMAQPRVTPVRGRGQMGGRGVMRTLGQPGTLPALTMGRGQVLQGRGRATPVRGQIRGQVRGAVRGQVRGQMMQAARMVTPTKLRGGRGLMMPQVRGQVRPVVRAGQIMGRGGMQMMRGGAQVIQRPRVAQSMQAMQMPHSRRGRPPANSIVTPHDSVNYSNPKRPLVQSQRKPLPVPAPAPQSVSPTPSWHTPSTNNPVSPPRLDGTNFKIKLPIMNRAVSVESDDDDIISLDPPPAKVAKHNGNTSQTLATAINRPGLVISKPFVEEGVDPLSLDNVSDRRKP